jgi:hypothetical protein
VTRQRAHQVVHAPGFPAPVAQVNGSAVWLAAEADRWRKARKART